MTRVLIDERVDYPSHSVQMERDGFAEVPQVALPAGYRIRLYREGDGAVWTGLQRAAEPFLEITDELFENEYGAHREALTDRMWFVETNEGVPAGSISAWFETGPNVPNDRGRIHWVVVHPDHQRRGISKSMMTVAMARLADSHPGAVLGTSSGRPWAVKVYLDFGFVPRQTQLSDPDVRQAWRNLQSVIDHPTLEPYVKG